VPAGKVSGETLPTQPQSSAGKRSNALTVVVEPGEKKLSGQPKIRWLTQPWYPMEVQAATRSHTANENRLQAARGLRSAGAGLGPPPALGATTPPLPLPPPLDPPACAPAEPASRPPEPPVAKASDAGDASDTSGTRAPSAGSARGRGALSEPSQQHQERQDQRGDRNQSHRRSLVCRMAAAGGAGPAFAADLTSAASSWTVTEVRPVHIHPRR
jgi:hypothetical protein